MWQQNGGRFEVLRGAEISERYPDLETKDADHGILDHRSGFSEPHHYVAALKTKLEDMGVEFRENECVVGFELRRDRVREVVTAVGSIEADAIVCAVNAWTNHVLSLVGIRIPYKNFVHERFVTKPFGRPPRLPAVNDHILDCYVRPTDDNRLLVGTSIDVPAYEMRGPEFHVGELQPHPDALPYIEDQFRESDAIIGRCRLGLSHCGIDQLVTRRQTCHRTSAQESKGLYIGSHFHSGGFAYNTVSGLLHRGACGRRRNQHRH